MKTRSVYLSSFTLYFCFTVELNTALSFMHLQRLHAFQWNASELLAAGSLGVNPRQKPLNLHFLNCKICSGMGLSFLLILYLHQTYLTFKQQRHFLWNKFWFTRVFPRENHFLWNWCGTIHIWSISWMISNYIYYKVWEDRYFCIPKLQWCKCWSLGVEK